MNVLAKFTSERIVTANMLNQGIINKYTEMKIKSLHPDDELQIVNKIMTKLPKGYIVLLDSISHERKMAEDKELKEWYCKQIPDYIQKGYVRKAAPYELLDTSDKINYILHFVVINRNKPIHKPRLVFGAAAKNQGTLLNSKLLAGPEVTASLLGVLIRFTAKLHVPDDIGRCHKT